ncbi:phosphatase PAP2 family protein [Qipengyuania nanhaisediminis]|uniref:phosphatase PAP2 family protein n=1 Tax=Qipengyuania nanhaisediminis TaxID=604088 RepID=UPI0038B2E610
MASTPAICEAREAQERAVRNTRDAIRARWIGEVPILAIGSALMALCLALLASKGINPGIGGIIANAQIFAMFVVVLVCWDAARTLYQDRPKSPIAHLRARYGAMPMRRRILAGLPMLGVAIVLLPYFSKMKSAIPLFNEYSWDAAFIAWDREIFFGYDAWQVLQPLLGYPLVTAFLGLLYQLWFLLLYPGVMWFAFARTDEVARRQFFLSYVLSWTLVGGLMATWLASVGPVFVGPILGDPTFDMQMDYLRAANETVPIMVLPVQEMLLEWYHQRQDGLGSGITAMPSMHCAIAFLYWIAVRQVSPRWGAFFGVFFFITWISSVHLAYHYAVDGLVSLLAVALIWRVSGRLVRAWDRWLSRRASVQPTLRTKTVPAE